MNLRILLAIWLLSAACTRHGKLDSRVGSWNSKTGLFSWWAGEVTLPVGFNYQGDPSDTFEGHFTSPDGRVVVHHDIGFYAGAWASKERAFMFEEREVEGSRVWIRETRRPRGTIIFAVTFPDSGCANFYIESTDRGNFAVVEAVARSFRPKSRRPRDSRCPKTRLRIG